MLDTLGEDERKQLSSSNLNFVCGKVARYSATSPYSAVLSPNRPNLWSIHVNPQRHTSIRVRPQYGKITTITTRTSSNQWRDCPLGFLDGTLLSVTSRISSLVTLLSWYSKERKVIITITHSMPCGQFLLRNFHCWLFRRDYRSKGQINPFICSWDSVEFKSKVMHELRHSVYANRKTVADLRSILI